MNFTESEPQLKRRQWSIKSLLLWTLIVALAIPYLLAMLPGKYNPVLPFRVGQKDFLNWLSELDPNIRTTGGGGGGGTTNSTSYNLDYEYAFSSNVATDVEMFKHLTKKLQQKMKEEKWNATSISLSDDYQALYFHNSFAAYRVFIWMIPLNDNDRKSAKAMLGQPIYTLRVKWLTIGYSKFHGNWAGQVITAD